jgi:hypothetical protein
MSARGHFRALARQPLDLPGALAAEDGRWQSPARVLDLGLGGARLVTDFEVPAGASVRLSLDSPRRWDPLELDARVAWSNPKGAGTELGLRFAPSTRHVLRGLLELLVEEIFD